METPIWDKLMEFETRDLVARYIKTKFNRKASARQISEITSNFIQGREYFRNAENADIVVKPLLQYYGVAALSRGLVLAITPHQASSALKPSHGLQSIGWQESLANNNFADIQVEVTDGGFTELLTATSNKSYMKVESNAVSWHVQYEIPSKGVKIRFEDLVKTIPDLKDQYKKWQLKNIDFIPFDTLKLIDDKHYEYSFPQKTEKELIESVFSNKMFPDLTIDSRQSKVFVKTTNDQLPQISQQFFDPFKMGMGRVVVTRTIPGETQLNTLAQFYCLSYFLGMLARYFPSVWICLGRLGKGDAVYPLIRNSIQLIEQYYPYLIYEFLEGPYSFEKKQ